ncbi:MAG: hypothetical protein APR62_02585 [Smithella sp. SDB]|nr:MAG: hypothetical protein APR62_02585 [Smithella sp. SDB]
MNEEKITPTSEEELDYSARPFGYQDMSLQTAMVCVSDSVIREKISDALKTIDFNVTEPAKIKEALKNLSFHTFNLVVVDENFDAGPDGTNQILKYLESLSMAIRRKIFVVLVSANLATMDYMYTLNKSVNLIINKEDIAEIGLIFKKEIEENEYFYHVFKKFYHKYVEI